MTNNDLQNTTQKTKDQETRTPLKTRGWTPQYVSGILKTRGELPSMLGVS